MATKKVSSKHVSEQLNATYPCPSRPTLRRPSCVKLISFVDFSSPPSFSCIFQFGYEQRSLHSAGLLALDGLVNLDPASSLADDALKFTDTVTIYTNSNPTLAAQTSDSLQIGDILVDDRKILRLSKPGASATSSSSSSPTSTGNLHNIFQPLQKTRLMGWLR